MKDDKYTIHLTPNAKAQFWLETATIGATKVKDGMRNTKHNGPFVEDNPGGEIDRIGYWVDTAVPHDEPITFTFDNPGDTEGGRLLIVFNGDSPLVDPKTEDEDEPKRVYAFELKSNESKTFRTAKKFYRKHRDRRCTTRTCGAKYTVAYIDESGMGTRRALDPEVIIIH